MAPVVCAGSLAFAQAFQPTPPPDDPVREFASRSIERLALMDLRAVEDPKPQDYRRALRTFELALELEPDRVELARRAAEAAWATGDPDLLTDATRRVVRLDPLDTVAQLRLIIAKVGERQTVEARLRAYERFLGPRGSSIDASVRSRLAVDAALLHRERGETELFAERVSQAVGLDPSNKEAASLAVTYFAGAASDPVGLLELQLNLLRADPLDPNVHFSVARLLAAEGALARSVRFYESGMNLLTQVGQVGALQDVERLALMWQIEGPQAVVDEIERRLRSRRAVARDRYEQDLQADVPDDELLPPENVHLDPLYEKLRVLTGLSAFNFDAVDIALAELEAMNEQRQTIVNNPRLRPRGMTAQQVQYQAFAISTELQFMRAVANVQIEEFLLAVEQLSAQPNPAVRSLTAPLIPWAMFRDGRTQEALNTLNMLEIAGPPADLLRGLATEDLGDADRAAEIYMQMTRSDPLGAVGSWARSRMLTLLGRDDPRTEYAPAMEALADGTPDWLDRMTLDPLGFMSLAFDADATQDSLIRPARLRLRLTNVSSTAMAVGSNRPLNSSVLIQPQADAEGFLGQPRPLVLQLQRRLALGPRDKVDAVIDTGRTLAGALLELNSDEIVRHRWQALQGFRVGSTGALVPGPLCLADDSERVVRGVTPGMRETGTLAGRLREARGADLVHALAVFRQRLWLTWLNDNERDLAGRETPSDEALRSAAAAAGERFASGTPLERAMLLAALPSSHAIPRMEPFDRAVREDLTDRAVRGLEVSSLVAALAVLTRVAEADDPVLRSAASAGESALTDVANLVADRLAADRPSWTTVAFEAMLDERNDAISGHEADRR